MSSLSDINNFTNQKFIETFKNIIEYTPEVAEELLKSRPYKNLDEIFQSAATFLDKLDQNDKLKILKNHPDLSGKLCADLTTESSIEQKSAGLDFIGAEETKLLEFSNERYKHKFRFPFVICAKENKIKSILEAMQLRLENDLEEELKAGIEEVKKIAKHRIRAIVKEK